MAGIDNPVTPPAENPPKATQRQKANQILSSGEPREVIRRELAKLRETELLRLMHEAAVMDASPFWREIALRRFIRQRGELDGRQDP